MTSRETMLSGLELTTLDAPLGLCLEGLLLHTRTFKSLCFQISKNCFEDIDRILLLLIVAAWE